LRWKRPELKEFLACPPDENIYDICLKEKKKKNENGEMANKNFVLTIRNFK